MSSETTDNRKFLVGLLREANIIDEIIDDVVEACEIANYSPFALASNSMTVPALSEKLSLTQKEAETLKQVTLKRLKAMESTKESRNRSIEALRTKISVEVLTSGEEEPLSLEGSFLSLESLLDSSKEAKVIQGRAELDSTSPWTDYTAEEESSSTQSSNEKISMIHLMPEVMDESSGMTALADVCLDEAQRPRGRPFIPPLRLKDAGISFGVPNGSQSETTLFNSISFASIDRLSPIPLSRSPIRAPKKKQISKPKSPRKCQEGVKKTEKPKIPLPSYLRPTVASEARKAATLGNKDPSKGSPSKDGVLDQSMKFQSNINRFKKTKIPYSHFVKSTRAASVRMEFIKRRLESTSVEKDKYCYKKRSCSSKGAVHRSNNKGIPKNHAMIAV